MLNVGLTGGIGSGKSTAARMLRQRGALVIDADALAREVLSPDTPGARAVAERFGPSVVNDEGSIDRARLARVVFEEPGAREALEAITHPLIRDRTSQLRAAADPDSIVVHDVPLLVEKNLAGDYHTVIVVQAPAEQRVRRLTEDRGMHRADALARMEHQASDEERRRVADVVLDNAGSPEDLAAAIDRVWASRIEPYRANLASGRIHRPENAPVVVEYDERWDWQARRLIDRIGAALGERAPQIEHVGSTAVPGMEGKDAIDIQIGVRSLAEADSPEFIRDLTALGFPRVDEYRMDHPTDALPDPSLWVKRFHGSSDPGRVTHLHVREVNSAGWQYALLFRDWLRSDNRAAGEYVEMKRKIAESATDTDAYRKGRAPWFSDVWPRMTAWAKKTGWSS